MSDHDFERYLAILCGVLRLAPARRDEIAAELRDHLEERLAELLAKGMSREKAIVTALEEFGDAAGLAAEFLHILRKQRQRWFMKLTVTSVVASVALCLTVMALWPDSAKVRVTQRVVAQEQPGSGTQNIAPPGGVGSAPAPALATKHHNIPTEQKLAKRMGGVYPNTALNDVLRDISMRWDVEFYLNAKQLAEAGKDLNDPNWVVDIDLKRVRGDMLLDLVLRNAGLVYAIRDEIVIITTQEDMASTMEVRVYNCRDLINSGSLYGAPAGMMGGSGMMGAMGGGMGFSGAPAGGGGGLGGAAFGNPAPGGGGFPGAGGIGGGGFPGGPAEGGLGDSGGAGSASGSGGVGGQFGGAAPAAGAAAPPGLGGGSTGFGGMAGKGRGGMAGGMSMGSMPGGMGGGMPGMPGMGMPGMPAMPGMSGSGMGTPGMPGGGLGGGIPSSSQYVPELAALIAVLTTTVMPETWSHNGGSGSIEPYFGGLLIVNNNPQAHQKIDQLLKMMRLAVAQEPGAMVREE